LANELRHKEVGGVLTEAEYDAVDAHEFDAQATGDIGYASSSTQLSRLGIGSEGQHLRVASGVPAWETVFVSAFKSADETKNEDTTLAADSELAATLEADSSYEVEMAVHMGTDATPDFKMEVRVPSGATVRLSAMGNGGSGSAEVVQLDGSGAEAVITGHTDTVWHIKGYVYTDATPGDLEYWWAQNTSDVADTTVKKGSWLRVRKVG
jgi:hypothetical protein